MNSRPQNSDAIRVFISYSQRDLTAADHLVTALEGEGFKVTIDRRDLPLGEEWLKELADFIAASDTVVALVSPAFVASKACNWELGQVRATNKRLVPVVIEPVPIEDLPEAIGKIQLLPAQGAFNLEAHVKPLAEVLNTDREWIKEHTRLADRARQWIVRGRAPALLLRGSALKDAEAWQDRQPKAAPAPSEEILELMLASRRASTRRQRAIAVGSLFAAIIAFVLAGAAAFQWQRAEASYAAARTNLDTLVKDLAEEMQNAEGMTVSIVNGILEKGQELAGNLKEASGGDARLEATRAKMFYQFGKTYQKFNQRAKAIKASNDSLEIWRRLGKAHPHDQDYAAALAGSLDLAGDLEREQKQFAKAREFYEESARTGSALNTKFPANADYAVQLSKTLIRLGDLDRFDKRFAEAKARYDGAFEKTKGVLRRTAGEPSIGLQRELTWNYNKIGDVSADLKDYSEADAAYRNGLCVREYLFSKDQSDTLLLHDISWSLSKIAAVKIQVQDFAGALDAEFASLAKRRKLTGSDPKNRIWRRDLAASLHQIGEISAKAGDYASAIAFFVAASEARLALKKDVPDDPAIAASFQASMARAREVRAKRLEAGTDWAERPYREAVAEEEQAATAKARASALDPSVCFNAIVEGLRGRAAEARS
jgi:tetratricopeptide (TPR) repeat protein